MDKPIEYQGIEFDGGVFLLCGTKWDKADGDIWLATSEDLFDAVKQNPDLGYIHAEGSCRCWTHPASYSDTGEWCEHGLRPTIGRHGGDVHCRGNPLSPECFKNKEQS